MGRWLPEEDEFLKEMVDTVTVDNYVPWRQGTVNVLVTINLLTVFRVAKCSPNVGNLEYQMEGIDG